MIEIIHILILIFGCFWLILSGICVVLNRIDAALFCIICAMFVSIIGIIIGLAQYSSM